MIVMKFGGTSVGDAERIESVCKIVRDNLENKPVVVCSAMTKVTDALIELAADASKGEFPEKKNSEMDARHVKALQNLKLDAHMLDDLFDEKKGLLEKIMKKGSNAEILDSMQSLGERMSCGIVAACLSKNVKARAFDAYDVGMITDSNFGSAEPLENSAELIKKSFRYVKEVPIVTGFIGKDANGKITTLGRGGSDYTAAIIGAALDAEEIQIWTDVDGVMTSDPRIVKDAITVPELSFDEASELAIFGAKVLHPKTILPAMEKNIPVRVLNTWHPMLKGTTIVAKAVKGDRIVKGIACRKNITLLNIKSTRMLNAYGYLAKVFEIFRKNRISVDMIATTEVGVSMTVDSKEHIEGIITELGKIAEVKSESGKAIVCVVGEGMRSSIGVAGRLFSRIAKEGINIEMISQGASEINVGLVVDGTMADKAVRALHDEFINGEK